MPEESIQAGMQAAQKSVSKQFGATWPSPSPAPIPLHGGESKPESVQASMREAQHSVNKLLGISTISPVSTPQSPSQEPSVAENIQAGMHALAADPAGSPRASLYTDSPDPTGSPPPLLDAEPPDVSRGRYPLVRRMMPVATTPLQARMQAGISRHMHMQDHDVDEVHRLMGKITRVDKHVRQVRRGARAAWRRKKKSYQDRWRRIKSKYRNQVHSAKDKLSRELNKGVKGLKKRAQALQGRVWLKKQDAKMKMKRQNDRLWRGAKKMSREYDNASKLAYAKWKGEKMKVRAQVRTGRKIWRQFRNGKIFKEPLRNATAVANRDIRHASSKWRARERVLHKQLAAFDHKWRAKQLAVKNEVRAKFQKRKEAKKAQIQGKLHRMISRAGNKNAAEVKKWRWQVRRLQRKVIAVEDKLQAKEQGKQEMWTHLQEQLHNETAAKIEKADTKLRQKMHRWEARNNITAAEDYIKALKARYKAEFKKGLARTNTKAKAKVLNGLIKARKGLLKDSKKWKRLKNQTESTLRRAAGQWKKTKSQERHGKGIMARSLHHRVQEVEHRAMSHLAKLTAAAEARFDKKRAKWQAKLKQMQEDARRLHAAAHDGKKAVKRALKSDEATAKRRLGEKMRSASRGAKTVTAKLQGSARRFDAKVTEKKQKLNEKASKALNATKKNIKKKVKNKIKENMSRVAKTEAKLSAEAQRADQRMRSKMAHKIASTVQTAQHAMHKVAHAEGKVAQQAKLKAKQDKARLLRTVDNAKAQWQKGKTQWTRGKTILHTDERITKIALKHTIARARAKLKQENAKVRAEATAEAQRDDQKMHTQMSRKVAANVRNVQHVKHAIKQMTDQETKSAKAMTSQMHTAEHAAKMAMSHEVSKLKVRTKQQAQRLKAKAKEWVGNHKALKAALRKKARGMIKAERRKAREVVARGRHQIEAAQKERMRRVTVHLDKIKGRMQHETSQKARIKIKRQSEKMGMERMLVNASATDTIQHLKRQRQRYLTKWLHARNLYRRVTGKQSRTLKKAVASEQQASAAQQRLHRELVKRAARDKRHTEVAKAVAALDTAETSHLANLTIASTEEKVVKQIAAGKNKLRNRMHQVKNNYQAYKRQTLKRVQAKVHKLVSGKKAHAAERDAEKQWVSLKNELVKRTVDPAVGALAPKRAASSLSPALQKALAKSNAEAPPISAVGHESQ